MAPVETEAYLWIVIAGAVASFVMSFGIGANDVANSFATSVGSGTLYLWQAVCIAAIFEFSGAVLVGASVTSTIRNGITDVSYFEDEPAVLMLGMFCALIGAGTWVLLATRLSLPVSTTHSIIGAIIGFTVVAAGWAAVEWVEVGLIVASWFISPLIAGSISALGYFLVRRYILRSPNSLARGYLFYPVLISITFAVNVFFVLYKGLPGLDLEETIPYWQGVLIAIAVAVGLAIILQFTAVPYIRRRINAMDDSVPLPKGTNAVAPEPGARESSANLLTSASNGNGNGTARAVNSKGYQALPAGEADEAATGEAPAKSDFKMFVDSQMAIMFDDDLHTQANKSVHVQTMHDNAEVFDLKTEELFAFLQVVTATFMSFAHGANDVANAIAPFAAIYGTYITGNVADESAVPIWILAMGGFGIVCGLTLYGYRVIRSIGLEMIKMTPSRGFMIELAAASTVVTASILGLPISTTHCQVGATVAVGLMEGQRGFNRGLFFKTFSSWIITIFFAAIVSMTIFAFAYYSP